jgi:hypothetical protein
MTREYAIAAIVGLIVLTSLGAPGGFPPAIAVAITLTGATVILMMVLAGVALIRGTVPNTPAAYRI